MLYNCVQKQVQVHVDFVNTHLDMIHDITGLGKLEGSELEAVLALEEEIQRASQRVTPTLQGPGWQNYPMTPVASSFVKGAGAYKGKLLVEYHHAPGKIWGYDVRGQGSEFFEQLMLSGSKGGWIWDNILGKPSQYGMAKGKFFSYKDANGEQKFATTPGAQFVHLFSRPAEFTYNPVGYLNDSEEWYNVRAQTGKEWKESLVDPSKSRNPIEASKLLAMQRNTAFAELQEMLKRRRALEEVRPLIEKEQRRGTLGEITELLKPHLTEGDFIELVQYLLNSQMTLTPIMSPVIDLVEDYKVKGYYANRGKPPVRTFIRRHTRGEGTTIKGKPRLTSKEVQEAHKESIEGRGKLRIQGYYSMEMIIGILSDLEAIGEMYPNNDVIQLRIDVLTELFNDLKKATTVEQVDSLESQIKNALSFLEEHLEQLRTSRKKEIEGAKIIGKLLSSVEKLKKYEDDPQVKQILSELKNLENRYASGSFSKNALMIKAQIEISKLNKLINTKEMEERAKRKDWDALDKEAEFQIKQYDSTRLQERKNRIVFLNQTIKNHRERIRKLKEQLKKVDPEKGHYVKPFREGELGGEIIFGGELKEEIKDTQSALRQTENTLEVTQNLNDINPPGKFEFHDTDFKLAGRSKFKEGNLKWLRQIKKEYLLIPARFRDFKSSRIQFVDKTYIGFRKSSSAGGTYSPASKIVRIATNLKVRNGFSDGSVVAHEIGHNVWYEKLTGDQKREFGNIWRDHRNVMRKIGDDYAATSESEGFAEAFMEYATGSVWYGRTFHNKNRIKDHQYPDILHYNYEQKGIPIIEKDANPKKWGMLDDYPEMRIFFNKNLGPNKNLEVNA